MSLLSTPAIVLGSMKLGEADKLVTFFTLKRGKLKGVAKGARRIKSRFGAALEPFTHCNLVVFEKPGDKLARISQSDIVHSFQKLREEWGRIYLASHMVHSVQRMTPDAEPNLSIYRLLLEGLTFLEKGADRPLSAILFIIRLVAHSGYQPRWDRCLKCHQPPVGRTIYFSPDRGGALCIDCTGLASPPPPAKPDGASPSRSRGSLGAERLIERPGERLIPISQGTLAFLRASQKMDYALAHRLKLSASMKVEIESLFGEHLTYITGAPSKTSLSAPTPMPEPVPR